MSKPTLGQIVELNKMHELALGIWKDGQYHYVFNEDVVKRFGDVEIYDLSVEFVTSRALTQRKFSDQDLKLFYRGKRYEQYL